MKIMKAWHFAGKTLRDGSPIPEDGVWLPVIDDPVLCERGYHASVDPFDALTYAPGDTLCLVELRGTIVEGDDKVVASERKILARMDATDMLRYYARMQALSVVHLWDAPDEVLDYLMTGEGAKACSTAAWSAAEAAARVAARATECSATEAAARAATEATACSATEAAYSAAYSAARSDFNALVNECFEGV